MNILFLSAYYPPATKGGAEISTHVLAKGLMARGHIVTVVTDGVQREERVYDGVKVLQLPLGLTGKPLFEHWAIARVAGIAKREIEALGSFDLVHAQDFRSALLLSELGFPRTIVTHRDYGAISGCTNNMTATGDVAHGCANDEWHCHRVAEAPFPRSMFRVWQYLYNKSYRRRAFTAFTHHVFISRAQQEILTKALSLPQPGTVIYNPLLPEYVSTSVQRGVTRTLLYVGTVEMYKGVRLLLEAWNKVAKSLPDWQLVVVGEGAQRSEYEELVATWGLQYRTHFKGRIPYEKLLPIYDEADIVVAPHVWIEPFGRTVAEGMARARLIIAANVGGPSEMITDGTSGFLFERGSVQALADTIIKATQGNHYDQRAMGDAARTWAITNLSADKIAMQYEEFYQSVI